METRGWLFVLAQEAFWPIRRGSTAEDASLRGQLHSQCGMQQWRQAAAMI